MTEPLMSETLKLGFAGVVIVGLAVVCVVLWRSLSKAHRDLIHASKAAQATAEQRHLEYKELAQTLASVVERNTQALTLHSQTLDHMADYWSHLVTGRRP